MKHWVMVEYYDDVCQSMEGPNGPSFDNEEEAHEFARQVHKNAMGWEGARAVYVVSGERLWIS